MKITLFTSNNHRHDYFINLLSKLCDELWVVQESKILFAGKNDKRYQNKNIIEKYFIKVLEAQNKILEAEILSEKLVRINMGLPEFKDNKSIPIKEGLDPRKVSIDFIQKEYGNGICVNVGNPHIIFFVKDCEKIDIQKIGPKIENHHYFPERINVTFAEVADDYENIKVNVWERGAGQTKACGTAACATAFAAKLNNLCNDKTDIEFENGKLTISIDEKNSIHMKGPVSDIKEIEINL